VLKGFSKQSPVKLGTTSPQNVRRNLGSYNYQSPNGRLNIEDITPEIASFVVKNYLLPMFESEYKRN